MLAENKLKNSLSLLLVAVASGIALSANAATQSTDVLEPAEPLSPVAEQIVLYEYILEGRPDPFVPFLSEKASTPTINPDEIVEEDVDLTGMRQFEPGQLTLVAVLKANDKKIAMVEDVTGKGYMLNEGIAIGRRGIVTEIGPQQILITETAHTRAGKAIKNTVIMRLQKEGDQ